MKILGVIPARYNSTRFPGKPLVRLLGKPMIIWVAEAAVKALGIQNVVIATDDERIHEVVSEYGYNTVMTSSKHLTGTDRLVEVANIIEADLYVNIQGDEPTIDYRDINKLIEAKIEFPSYVINGMTKICADEDPKSINIPKVVVNQSSNLIYMSRAMVPGYKDFKNRPKFYCKQVCIYVFSREDLFSFGRIVEKGPLEKSEDIEILRFLEINIPVKMISLDSQNLAVDEPEDVSKVEKKLTEIQMR